MRNVSRGLDSRTKILEAMEKGKKDVRDISEKSGLSVNRVAYHLKLMLTHRIVVVQRIGRVGRWTETKYGQERLF